MKTLFYYFRQPDKSKMPRVTVCLMYEFSKDTKLITVYARGMSFCSMKETPKKKVGNNYAYHRASFAISLQKNSMLIKERANNVLRSTNRESGQFLGKPDYDYKSCFMPKLTKYEEELIYKKESEN